MTTTRGRKSAATPPADVAPEAQMWRMADALRGSMDAAEYKHVVLGLVFLKYISDAFEERRAELDPEEQEEPDAYRGMERILGALGSAVAQPAGLRATAHHWAGCRRGHDRRRAGEFCSQGRAAEGLRPASVGQGAPWPRGGHGQQHPGGRRRGSCHRRAGPRVRVLPGAVRYCRGSQGRRVLHSAQRRAAARRDAGAVPWARVRPVLRLVGHVRAVGGVHSSPRQRQRQRRAGPRGTSPSTVRSPTTPPGGLPR